MASCVASISETDSTFAWLMRYRRLVRDYEQRLNVSEAMLCIALGSSLLNRMRFRRVFKLSLSCAKQEAGRALRPTRVFPSKLH